MTSTQWLALPSPCPIMVDDIVYGWELCSQPFVHLVVDLEIAEEIRSIRGKIDTDRLGEILSIRVRGDAPKGAWWEWRTGNIEHTYADIMRSNITQYFDFEWEL